MVGILSELGAALQGATAWTFEPATIARAGAVSMVNGRETRAPVNVSCMARVNVRRTQPSDDAPTFTTEILILAGSMAADPQRGEALTLGGKVYQLGECVIDGLASHWRCEVTDNG